MAGSELQPGARAAARRPARQATESLSISSSVVTDIEMPGMTPHYQDILARNPEDVPAWINMCVALQRQGRSPSAPSG